MPTPKSDDSIEISNVHPPIVPLRNQKMEFEGSCASATRRVKVTCRFARLRHRCAATRNLGDLCGHTICAHTRPAFICLGKKRRARATGDARTPLCGVFVRRRVADSPVRERIRLKRTLARSVRTPESLGHSIFVTLQLTCAPGEITLVVIR